MSGSDPVHPRFWRMEWKRLVRANYAEKGAAWCARQIGCKNRIQVRRWANQNGLYVQPGHYAAVRPTARHDALIRDAYAKDRNSGAIRQAARTLGVSLAWVKKRAQALGCAVPAGKPLTQAEAAVLLRHPDLPAHALTQILGEHGFRRSAASVSRFLARHGRKADDGLLTSVQIADGFGVSPTIVGSWVRKGLLAPTYRKADGIVGTYHFREEEVARFVVLNPAIIERNRTKVDLIWLIDLIARLGSVGLIDAKDKGARIVALKQMHPEKSNAEIAAMLDSTPNAVAVNLWRARKGKASVAAQSEEAA